MVEAVHFVDFGFGKGLAHGREVAPGVDLRVECAAEGENGAAYAGEVGRNVERKESVEVIVTLRETDIFSAESVVEWNERNGYANTIAHQSIE